MSRRTITDEEISLIKAMLDRGMKNKDIQFFFNRPERPVNTGRISNIGAGTYSISLTIPAASSTELDSFIAGFEKSEHGVSVATDGKISEPTIAEKARALFERSDDGNWILSGGENQECECKQDFDPKKLTPVVRAIAALANNRGGYIFFGVLNKGHRAQGIGETFASTDIVQIIEKVKTHLSPTPSVTTKGVINLDGLAIGFIHVAQHPNPPVIVYRDGDGINEGEILFRYPGQSARIKFGDLRSMLEDRDRRAQMELANAAGRLATVGTANAMILDTDKNIIEENGRTILIDEQLATSLKFIKEGEFDEKSGAPTLRLLGEVSPVTIKNGAVISGTSYAAIFQENILEKFLEQTEVDQPIQYIYAGLAQSRLWLPIFYFARLSGKTNKEIVELVKELKVAQKGKKTFLIERLERKRSSFTKTSTRLAAKIAEEISQGRMIEPTVIAEVSPFAQALTAVKATKAGFDELLRAVRQCKEIAEAADNGGALGATFKAACWLDELFFADQKQPN